MKTWLALLSMLANLALVFQPLLALDPAFAAGTERAAPSSCPVDADEDCGEPMIELEPGDALGLLGETSIPFVDDPGSSPLPSHPFTEQTLCRKLVRPPDALSG